MATPTLKQMLYGGGLQQPQQPQMGLGSMVIPETYYAPQQAHQLDLSLPQVAPTEWPKKKKKKGAGGNPLESVENAGMKELAAQTGMSLEQVQAMSGGQAGDGGFLGKIFGFFGGQ